MQRPLEPRRLSRTLRPRPALGKDATHEQAAEAAFHCAGFFPDCFADDRCHHGGKCFKPDGMGYARIKRSLERMLVAAAPPEARWLIVALDAIKRHHSGR